MGRLSILTQRRYVLTNSTLWTLLALLVLCLPAALPLLAPGFIGTRAYGDSPFLLQRVFALDRAISSGVWYPRWSPDLAYGYGYPLFNYYGPLPYYLAETFKLLGAGYIGGIKLAFLTTLFGAGLTMYALVRMLWGAHAGLLAGVAYVYAPYHLANVYLRGDALSEFTAYAWFPLVLWLFLRLARDPSSSSLALAAASYAGLIYTHNISALTFTPILIAFVLLALLVERTRWRAWAAALSAGVLALGLAAAFWLPALGERDYVQLEHMTTGYFDFRGHFLSLSQVMPLVLVYPYDVAEVVRQGLPFRLGLVQVLASLPALFWLLWSGTRCLRGVFPKRADKAPVPHLLYAAFFLLLGIVGVALMLPTSTSVWERVPLLTMVQFPWRLLSIAALATSVLTGGLALALRTRPTLLHVVSPLLCAALVLSSTLDLRPERWRLSDSDITAGSVLAYEYITSSIGSTARYEYLPRWVKERPWSSPAALTYPDLQRPALARTSSVQGETLSTSAHHWSLRLEVDQPVSAQLHSFYFPGWRARVNGSEHPVRPSDPGGMLEIALPTGSHLVELSFENTPLRSWAERLSVICLALWLCLWGLAARGWLVSRRSKLASPSAATPATGTNSRIAFWRPLIVYSTLAIMLSVGRLLWIDPWQVPTAFEATEEWSIIWSSVSSPWPAPRPAGIAFDKDVSLLAHSLSPKKAAAGDLIDLRLKWQERTELTKTLQARARLISPPEMWGRGERTLAQDEDELQLGQATLDQRVLTTSHRLRVPQGTPPGLYLIGVSLHDGDRRLLISGAWSRPADGEILLGPLVVERSASRPSFSTDTLANFGNFLALLGSQASVRPTTSGDEIEMSLLWQAMAPMPEDYRVSLRLLDEQGHRWGQADAQPTDGLYPTGMWLPGEMIMDRHYLRSNPGTPPGTYRLELWVYSLRDLSSLDVLDANHAPSGQSASLGSVRLTSPQYSDTNLPLQRLKPVPLAPEIDLLGQAIHLTTVSPGSEIELSVGWRAHSAPGIDYLLRFRLVDTQGSTMASWEQAPANQEHPTSAWQPGEVVLGQYSLRVPATTPSGRYRLVAGLGNSWPEHVLGEVEVAGRPRLFEVPAIQTTLKANLGDSVTLLGFDLSTRSIKKGETLVLTLYWLCRKQMDYSYTVFTHLLDARSRISGQRDSVPGDGSLPTSGWVESEIIVDRYEITVRPDAPAGAHTLEIGMYDAATGQRLPVFQRDQRVEDDRLPLTEVEVTDR